MIALVLALAQAVTVAQGDPVKVTDGLRMVEGIAFNADDELFLADSAADTIWKWDGKALAPWKTKVGKPAGIRFHKDGDLYVCETRNKRVTRIAPDGTLSVVAEKFSGAKFNSPTDLCLDDKGGLYFTDPNYGGDANRTMAIEGVYYVGPGGTPLARVADDLKRPHGIGIWADLVYVADVGMAGVAAPPQCMQYVVDPARPGALRKQGPVPPGAQPVGAFTIAYGSPQRHSWGFFAVPKGLRIQILSGNIDFQLLRFPMTPTAIIVHKDTLYVASGRSLYKVGVKP